jgi:Fe-S cluster biogenesis protein NfuA
MAEAAAALGEAPAPASTSIPASAPAPASVPVAAARLRDDEVRERLSRLEHLLALVEETPGPSGELAMSAVTELAQVYGEALARAVCHAAESPALLESLVRDELIGHLLVLHDIHPEPAGPRVARAVDALRPMVAEQGGEIALLGVEDGVAKVTLSVGGCGSGCGSSAQGLHQAVREAVLSVAPELDEVSIVAGRPPAAPAPSAFIPLSSLGAQALIGGVPS